MTSGVMLPLMTADMLAMTIVGSVLENMDMERLIGGESSRCSLIIQLMSRNRNAGGSADQGEGRDYAERGRGRSVSSSV